MKITMEFALPEEASEYHAAFNGGRYKSVLHSLDHHLRQRLKYADIGKEARKELQAVRTLLWEEVPDLDDEG